MRDAPAADLALVRVEGVDLPCLPVRSTPAKIGTDVLAIGSPGGAALSHSVSKGIVSGYREVDARTVVQTDATINPGNSGGPLVSPAGELIGVVSFKIVGDGIEGLGFAAAATSIPAELKIRWGHVSDPSPSIVPVPAASELLARSMPKVELGPGLQLDTQQRYRMRYRPRTGTVAAGLLIGAAGAIVTGWTIAEYDGGQPMSRKDWRMLEMVNAVSISTTVVGVGLVGLGVAIPSSTGPIVPERM